VEIHAFNWQTKNMYIQKSWQVEINTNKRYTYKCLTAARYSYIKDSLLQFNMIGVISEGLKSN